MHSKLGLIVRTISRLGGGQLAQQLRYRLCGGIVRARARRVVVTRPDRREWRASWNGPAFLSPRQIDDGVFRILGETHRVETREEWSDPDRTRLWLYNCHYLDDVANPAPDCRSRAVRLYGNWMVANPRMAGVGWEPYPLSLRIVNLVKWFSTIQDVPPAWMQSLAEQASALEWQLEYHLRGNHLLANAKALVFAGAFCEGRDGDRWLSRGAGLLREQLREQFLGDGGHFERSPMYHALLLWDIFDLIQLETCCRLSAVTDLAAECRPIALRGIAWLEAMCHPDGDVSFFNDATFGVGPRLDQIRAYAKQCRLVTAGDAAVNGLTLLEDTGFCVMMCEPGAKAIADVGSLGPRCQPGHAHAGTLSFELSVGGQRVVVNSGVSTYALGPERHWERSTVSHSTVEVAGTNSSEVWASFRVGRGARIVRRAVSSNGSLHEVKATHDGYARPPLAVLHTRQCSLHPGGMAITDTLSRGGREAICRMYLHPDVVAESAESWRLPDGTMICMAVQGGLAQVRSAEWHPAFGESLKTTCIELVFHGTELSVSLAWGP